MKKKKNATTRELDQRIDITNSIEVQKAAKLKEGEIEVIVSNSGTDRHGESIQVEGIDLKQVKRNPVVLWTHDYLNLPIGKITKLWKSEGNLMARIQFATDIYEFAGTVYKMIQEGYLNAVSIGGIVKAFGQDKSGLPDYDVIAELEMIEVSVVPVGAHPDALVTAKSFGVEPEEFTRQYEDFVHKSLVDKMKVFPQNDLKQHITSLKALTSALQDQYDSAASDSNQSDKTKTIKKLVLAKTTAKQIDKQAELIIAVINRNLNA
jgi:HK97 family phage prohead protease